MDTWEMRGVKDTVSLEPLVDAGRFWKTTSSPVYSKVCLYCAALASLFSVGEQIETKGLSRARVPSTAMWMLYISLESTISSKDKELITSF